MNKILELGIEKIKDGIVLVNELAAKEPSPHYRVCLYHLKMSQDALENRMKEIEGKKEKKDG